MDTTQHTKNATHHAIAGGGAETTDERFERGLALLRTIGGEEHPAVLGSLADIAPGLGRMTVAFAYGDVLARPGLGLRGRQIATVGALAAMGNAAPQLRFHIDGALNVGVSPAEIVEILIQTAVYAGFPAALNGIAAAREVFASRSDLAADPVGTEPPAGDRYERGLAKLAEVDGHAADEVVASLRDIAPDLMRYIVEFAFGDIYARPGLDLKSRELAAVAMCTALGTAAPQLRVHLHGLLNVGGTREEAVEVITQMASYAGFPAALNGMTAARQVFAERAAH
ncbi:carboxymuconolactone decarboxylase family protein [Streptomyces sp. NBC_00083]|uniref:carboxymuconolactone decarboxylase family protein n=1 Tax=Streptomyces sp. NBC_00083 TaxID=2975647 RepID=UPI00224D0463|nr:carboxymuconolactone decarboxylase family protein [Streptomyces sp. NBC_00083]MCX5383976.1 carboxymuconolactone decarboxylase family protein [Streptomyces sp. NBC_00083]